MALALYPLLIIVLTFYGARFTKKDPTGYDFLTQSKMIRASACISIILHHLVQLITNYGAINKGIVTSFNYLGFLFTSLFFFFSGFGLIASFYSKPGYLDTFLIKRLPGVLIPFWVINLFGVVINNILYPRGKSALDLFFDISGITLLNSNGWFIIEIVLLYLIFYFLFKRINNKDFALFLMFVSIALIIFISFMRGHGEDYSKTHWFQGEWWYNSTITFFLGMLYGRCKDSWNTFFDRYYKVLLPVTSVLFAVTMQLSLYALWFFGYYHGENALGKRDAAITLFSQIIACIFFDLLVVQLNRKVSLGNKALSFISTFSLELFLIHGYFVGIIFDKIKAPEALLFALVFAASILSACGVGFLDRFLVKKAITILTLPKKKPDRKKLIKYALVVLLILLLVLVFFLGRHTLFAKSEFKNEMKVLKDSGVGDEVRFGTFDTDFSIPGKEPVTWIVIDKQDGEICLLSKKGLGGSYYNQKHAEITWGESDIRKLINSSEYLTMFSKYELGSVLEKDGDKISLLTPDKASSFFPTDTERELTLTEAAKAKGVNINYLSKYNYWGVKDYHTSWWWLKGSDTKKDIYAPIVTSDGIVETDTKEVNKPSGAIRPLIWVSISD